MARPRNITLDGDIAKYTRACNAADKPKIRKALLEIIESKVKEEQYDPKTGSIILKAVSHNTRIDACNSYEKIFGSKVEAVAKADQNVNLKHYTATDAVKDVEAKKRAEYEKKLEKERQAKEAGKLAGKVIGGN